MKINIFISLGILSCIFTMVADSEIPIKQKSYGQAESLLLISKEFTRKALLEAKLPRHIVKKGENLYRISKNYFVSLENLQLINQISNPQLIKIGRSLYIPPVDKSAANLQKYQIEVGDTINSVIIKYNIQKWQFERLNPGLTDPLPVGLLINLPLTPLAKSDEANISFIRPVRGFLTSRYGFRWGRMHYGLDLGASTGTPVKAAAKGKVCFVGWLGSYGLLIKINHGQYSTYYGHLSRALVSTGRKVNQGEIIGLVGATGRAYGSHLHFEVEKNGIKVNPYFLIN